MKKIGIFGGSFDPVHTGHVDLAADAMRIADLDKIIFVPARIQPFKQDRQATSGEHRMNMLRLATEGMDGAEISAYELEKDGISYTYQTLDHFREKYSGNSGSTKDKLSGKLDDSDGSSESDRSSEESERNGSGEPIGSTESCKLYFLCGSDTFLKIQKWMHADYILENYSFIIGSRPGYTSGELQEIIDQVQAEHATEVTVIENRQFDISSTQLRQMLADSYRTEAADTPDQDAGGRDLRQYIDEAVFRYIKDNRLYEQNR